MKHHLLTKSCLLLFVLMMTSSIAMAQFTAAGSVKDAAGEALIGASVIVKGTALGTITDLDGSFKILIPSENSAELEISYVGYTTLTQTVTKDGGNIEIVLSDAATTIDEVVVTGLASSVKRSNSANSVASISSKDLTGVTVQSTMDGALYGKFKGAEIKSNSGAPGGGMSVKLRGVTSVFLDQQPLYIIDGVYVDNSTISLGTNIVSSAAGGGNTATNQDDASNRVADIDPEDIETIEILKGASAAAIYGSRAAGGVVIINTKKGRSGKNDIKVSQTIGGTSPTRLLGDRGWTAEKIASAFYSAPAEETDAEKAEREAARDAEIERFNANGVNDYEAELYDNTGLLSTTRLEFMGGNDKTRYFVGGSLKTEEGIVQNTGYGRKNVRVNLSHKFTNWLDVDINSTYINSEADRGFFNNGNTNTTVGYALAFTRPWVNLFPDEDGNYPANPAVGSNVLETVAVATNRENTNRFIGGGRANIKLFSNETNNLKLVIAGGVDQYLHRTTALFPQSISFYRDPGSLGGVSISGSTVTSGTNLSGVLVHSLYTESGLTFRTQAGLTQIDRSINTVITTATGLNGSQTNVDQAANAAAFQNRIIEQDKGGFLQEEINWQDKVIATIGVRADKSSNNGDPNKLYYYPKANLAVNLHEFDLWENRETLSNVKVRVAYGQAGRFANFGDRFNLLGGTVIGGQSGLVTSSLLGNTAVEPERQTELEFGTDLGFLKNKLTLDFTYYIKSVDDVLLRQQFPTSSGFSRKVVNAAELQNQGFEIGLNATPVATKNFRWSTAVNFWKNKSKVTRLDIPAFNLGGFAASLGQYRIQEGKSATQIVGTYNPDDCVTGDCSDLDPDGDGMRVYGDAEADFNMSFIHGFEFSGLELNFVLHWKQGGDAVNLSTLLWDLAGLTWDYDDLTLAPDGETPNGDYRTGEWFSGNAGPWIEDASYFRVREIGLFYNIPTSVFNDKAKIKVGVSGRNVVNIFNYNSYDPEVSNFGGNVLANAIEVTPFPASKRFNFHVQATF